MALVPLLVVLSRPARARRLALLGWLAGVVYFGGTVYWVNGVMAAYGDMSGASAAAIAVLLTLYLAIYPGLFALIMGAGVRAAGPRALWAAPLVWSATEFCRGDLVTGFPWVPLGNSQIDVAPIAQVASLVGVYGLSAIVALTSVALAWLVAGPAGRSRFLPAAGVAVFIGGLALWGGQRVSAGVLLTRGTPLRVALIQGNVAQGQKWDAAFADAIYQRYLALSRRGVAEGATLVMWPESATPFLLEENPAAEAIRLLARESGARLFVGSDQREPGGRDAPYYNAAFLIQPTGSVGGVYRKIHLVPFGEYVPFKSLFFFANSLVEQVGGFSPGRTLTIFHLREGTFSTGICYEVVFPDLTRTAVRQGSQLLTTITNDAWFGRSSAPWQHLAMARMRTIETGRYMARSANTGISALVDPYGRLIQSTPLFEEAVSVGEVRMLDGTTPYVMIGDVVPWAGVAASLGLVTLGVRARRRAPSERPSP